MPGPVVRWRWAGIGVALETTASFVPSARPILRPTTLQTILSLLLEQGEEPRIKELAVLREVLAKKTLLVKAALFGEAG